MSFVDVTEGYYDWYCQAASNEFFQVRRIDESNHDQRQPNNQRKRIRIHLRHLIRTYWGETTKEHWQVCLCDESALEWASWIINIHASTFGNPKQEFVFSWPKLSKSKWSSRNGESSKRVMNSHILFPEIAFSTVMSMDYWLTTGWIGCICQRGLPAHFCMFVMIFAASVDMMDVLWVIIIIGHKFCLELISLLCLTHFLQRVHYGVPMCAYTCATRASQAIVYQRSSANSFGIHCIWSVFEWLTSCWLWLAWVSVESSELPLYIACSRGWLRVTLAEP